MLKNLENLDNLIDWAEFYRDRVPGLRRSGSDKLSGRCPFHADQNASFWVRVSNSCWKCESGCGGGNAVSFLVKSGECSDTKAAWRKLCEIAGVDASAAKPASPKPQIAPVTLAGFAQHKHFDVSWLRDMGLNDGTYKGASCVVIPYRDAGGAVVAVRRRHGTQGAQRFSWQSGAKPRLYGLWLDLNKNAESLVLVEGESDALSLWSHSVPALGVPGASTFQAGWVADLAQAKTLYIHIENDNGGAAFRRKCAAALHSAGFVGAVCEIAVSAVFSDCKDPSDVYCKHGDDWPSAWAAVLATARPVDLIAAGAQDAVQNETPAAVEGANTNTNTLPALALYSAADLQKMDLAPTPQIVESMLTPGLAVLAARAKLGKSWLCASLALSVSTGTPFLGRKTSGGDVLLLDLEGSPWRLRERFSALWHADFPPRLQISHRTDGTIAGGDLLQQIDGWRKSVESPKIVIVDTLARVKGVAGGRNENAYETDSRIFGRLASYAMENSIAILLVHHLRKSSAVGADVLDQISGSLGLTGVADCILFLQRDRLGDEKDEAKLFITGRDIDQQEIVIKWQNPGWRLVANDADAWAFEQQFGKSDAVTALRRFVSDWKPGHIWSGRASDLLVDFSKAGIACDATPNTLGSDFRRFEQKIYDDLGVMVYPQRTRAGNGFKIERCSPDGF